MTGRAGGGEPTGDSSEKSSTEATSRAEWKLTVESEDDFRSDDESEATSNETAEVVREPDLPEDLALPASLSQEAIIHFYMAEALERITDRPDLKDRAVKIKRIEAAQVKPFPPRAVTCDTKKHNKLRRLVETGTEESFWEAFHIPGAASLVPDLIANEVGACPGIARTAESALESLLQQQATTQLWKALELAQIPEEIRHQAKAIDIMLAELRQITDRNTIFSAFEWLPYFEPKLVKPKLLKFLREVDGGYAREAAFDALECVFARESAPDASDSSAFDPWAEGPIESVEPPRTPISSKLRIPPPTGETSPVPRMDESQAVSPDTTAAPLHGLEAPSREPLIDLNAARVEMIWRELGDIAAADLRAIPAILEGFRSFATAFAVDPSASVQSAKSMIERPRRPAAGSFLDHGEMMRWAGEIERWRINVPFREAIAEVRAFVEFSKGKRFPTPEGNVELAKTARGLVEGVGCEFRYDGKRARLSCVPATGRFEVFPPKRGTSYVTSAVFPNLEITPLEGVTQAVTS